MSYKSFAFALMLMGAVFSTMDFIKQVKGFTHDVGSVTKKIIPDFSEDGEGSFPEDIASTIGFIEQVTDSRNSMAGVSKEFVGDFTEGENGFPEDISSIMGFPAEQDLGTLSIEEEEDVTIKVDICTEEDDVFAEEVHNAFPGHSDLMEGMASSSTMAFTDEDTGFQIQDMGGEVKVGDFTADVGDISSEEVFSQIVADWDSSSIEELGGLAAEVDVSTEIGGFPEEFYFTEGMKFPEEEDFEEGTGFGGE
ncbi:unnamed protein product [Calypogeia fissa]